MKKFKINVWSFAIAKLQAKMRSILAIALIAVMVSFTGCATNSSIGGTAEQHGWLSSLISSSTINKLAQEGSEEVASFTVIIGTLDIGYENYATKVKAAETRGKKITTVTTNYLGFVAIIKAYAR